MALEFMCIAKKFGGPEAHAKFLISYLKKKNMKKYKFLTFFAAMLLTFSACETEIEETAGLRGEGVIPAITNLNPAVFDINDPENTFIKFDLDVETATVSEINFVASYNGKLTRIPIKQFTSFPTTDVKIYMRDVAAALGIKLEDVSPGDIFTLEALTTQGENIYRSSAVINAAAVCLYDPEEVTGTYNAVSADWGADGLVTITVDPVDIYTVYVAGLPELDGFVGDIAPLKMTVDPLTFKVTAVKTVLGSVFDAYTNVAYEGFGLLNTCDGTYQMNFTITVDQGSFGQNAFTLTRVGPPSK